MGFVFFSFYHCSSRSIISVWIICITRLTQSLEAITLELRIKDSFNNSLHNINLDGLIRKKLAVVTMLSRPDEDTILSPISIIPPLAKLAVGATGLTLWELEAAVGFKRDHIRSSMRKLITDLGNVKGVTLNIITKLFMSKDFKLYGDYKSDIKSIFKSDIDGIDFSKNKDAASKINDWVNLETSGLIKKMVSPSDLHAHIVMILLSVVYFEGKWNMRRGFETGRNATFYRPSGPTIMEMMHVTYALNYVESYGLNAQVLEIPFQGGESSFIIILPYKRDGLSFVLNKIKNNPHMLNSVIQSMRETDIFLALPKFEITTKVDLIPLLKKLDVHGIFNGEGLSNIIKHYPKLAVQKAMQKSVIKVNEQGIMAASATVSEIIFTSSMISPKRVVADHPFLFYILAKGEQLFSGVFNGNEQVSRNDYGEQSTPDYRETEEEIYGRNIPK